MSKSSHSCRFELRPQDNGRLLNLCGQLNSNLQRLERAFGVFINMRGHSVSIRGSSDAALAMTRKALADLYGKAEGDQLSEKSVELAILDASEGGEGVEAEEDAQEDDPGEGAARGSYVKAGSASIKLRTARQRDYVASIREGGVTVGVGPAGTGKTYLAVACAAEAYQRRLIERIVLVRPAVEAGEKLGFLPGDIQQKVDPYLRPMFDALDEFFGEEEVARKIKHNRIEIASLAYMRGRTLNHSFIVMDEAQNATHNQMLMLLTRIGVGSTMVVNGDISQIDLPDRRSGLVEAMEILDGLRDVRLVVFGEADIHRSRLVREIVKAYQLHEDAKRAGS